jgi:hypothetical protein
VAFDAVLIEERDGIRDERGREKEKKGGKLDQECVIAGVGDGPWTSDDPGKADKRSPSSRFRRFAAATDPAPSVARKQADCRVFTPIPLSACNPRPTSHRGGGLKTTTTRVEESIFPP